MSLHSFQPSQGIPLIKLRGVDEVADDSRLGTFISEPQAIISDLQDDPAEAIAFALAHSVFELRFGADICAHLAQADAIQRRLSLLGYRIVKSE
jgi:hypothetical protein